MTLKRRVAENAIAAVIAGVLVWWITRRLERGRAA